MIISDMNFCPLNNEKSGPFWERIRTYESLGKLHHYAASDYCKDIVTRLIGVAENVYINAPDDTKDNW